MRREFLKKMVLGAGALAFGSSTTYAKTIRRKAMLNPVCKVYRAVNGSPKDNLIKVIDLMGGIEKLIGSDDIVIVKPNVQWWNHGAPNMQALQTFVDLIMSRPNGFSGEVIIAENCHRGSKPWDSRFSGWKPGFERNSGIGGVHTFSDLCRDFKHRYKDRFSLIHWIDVQEGGRRVFSPQDGCGYVYCDGTEGVPLLDLDNGLQGKRNRRVIMTYPIFKTDRGTMVDFKNGVWEKGAYTSQPLRFINFAALNHHSTYCGATSAVKNYLGISDLSGGPNPQDSGCLIPGYFNFHSFPFDGWAPGPAVGMLGAEIGVFMNAVRRADINITTAEWIGLVSRTELPVARTRTVAASTDPVALDYHMTKYLLYPNSQLVFHNPDDQGGPLNQYLRKCAEFGGCVFDESAVAVESWDFSSRRFQKDDELVVWAERLWGSNLKSLGKYAVLRWAPALF